MVARHSTAERIADGCVHIIGIGASIAAVSVLLTLAVPSLPGSWTAGLAIYGIAMIGMFAFSAAYHLIPVPHVADRLRRMDQAAIFLKIAGTYTPFALVVIGGYWGYGLLGAVWTVALIGAGVKLFLPGRMGGYTVALYLAFGWAGLIAIRPLAATMPPAALILLASGGVLYTIGVAFHLRERLPFRTAIWHGFVLAATACHYAAVVDAVIL